MSEIYNWLAWLSPVGLAAMLLAIPVLKAIKAERARRAFIPRPYVGETIYGREPLVLPSFPDEATMEP